MVVNGPTLAVALPSTTGTVALSTPPTRTSTSPAGVAPVAPTATVTAAVPVTTRTVAGVTVSEVVEATGSGTSGSTPVRVWMPLKSTASRKLRFSRPTNPSSGTGASSVLTTTPLRSSRIEVAVTSIR